MKSVLKVSLAALTLAFAVSSQAADKLVVATDTAFVPLNSNRVINTLVLTWICGPLSQKNSNWITP